MITKSGYGTSKTNNVSSEKTQRYKKLLEEPQTQTKSGLTAEDVVRRATVSQQVKERKENAMQWGKLQTQREDLEKQLSMANAGVYSLDKASKDFATSSPKLSTQSAEQKAKYEAKAADIQKQLDSVNSKIKLSTIGQETKKYTDTNKDTFWGRAETNYDISALQQKMGYAYSDYLDNPTEDNKKIAEAYRKAIQEAQENNPNTSGKGGWLDKSLAGYLPQLGNQLKAGGIGGATGAVVAGGLTAAGTALLPTVGEEVLIPKATMWGFNLGSAGSSAADTYKVMRGLAYQGLIDEGIDEETARAAASDEAFVNAAIEFASSLAGGFLLGTGKAAGKGFTTLLSKSGNKVLREAGEQALKKGTTEVAKKATVGSVAKGIGKAGFAVALDAGGEGLEEGSQQIVSIANIDRAAQGKTGKLNLVSEAIGKAFNLTDEEKAEVAEATIEGIKISLLTGGGTRIATDTINMAIDNNNAKRFAENGKIFKETDTVDSVIKTGLESDKNTTSYKLAKQLQEKIQSGQQVTDEELGQLFSENVKTIAQEEAIKYSPVNARQVLSQPNINVTEQGTQILPKAEQIKLKATGKETLIARINNNRYLNEQEKNSLIAQVQTNPYSKDLENGIQSVLKSVNEQVGLKNISNNFKENKSTYGKYANDTTEYDKSFIENAKNLIPANNSGRRTKEQWLKIADNLGSQISNMGDSEIERLAYRTWIDNQPNNPSNLNRQGQKYVKFSLDEWVNSVYESARQSRENIKVEGKPLALKPSAIYVTPEGQAMTTSTYSDYETGKLKLPTTKTNSVYKAAKGKVDVKIANRLMDIAERTNVRVEGFYDENPNIEGSYKDGVIRINVNSEKAADTIFAHEFTHHLESTNAWNDVRDAIINSNTLYNMLSEQGINIDEYKQQIRDAYAANGVELKTDLDVEKEIVAKFVENNLMKDEKTIVRMINENPSFMQRLKNFWDDLVVRFKGTAEEKELRRIQNIYNKAFAEAQKGSTTSTETEYSIGGIKGARRIQKNPLYSNILDNYNEALRQIKEAKSKGEKINNEKLIKDTGWYQDPKGNIKYEFTDEDMDLKPSFKFNTSKLYTLKQILKHDIIFEAYPELENYTVISLDLGSTLDGAVFTPAKIILLNKNKLNTKEEAKGTLMHEVQHAIQLFEGFPGARTTLGGKSAYFRSLGEIEAADTKRRIEMAIEERKQLIPETAKPNPIHPVIREKLLKQQQEQEESKKALRESINEVLQDDSETKDTQYSINTDNQGRKLSQQQQEFFKDSKVRDEDGRLKPVYHGTKRADRVGYYFDAAKATSGPMAFFTDDVEIATNYSKSKQDTSISREADTEYDLFKANGKDLDAYWDSLTPNQKKDIAEKGNNIGFDEDWENVVYGKNASEESFGDQYKWRLNREYNGNAIKTLYGIWIEDGNLMYEDMAKFKDILTMAGIENVEYLDKYKEDPKVYEVYMNLKNPFVTSNMNEEMFDKLQKASEKAIIGEQYTADSWDKSNIEPKDWMSMLRDDIRDGTTHSWTIIPDWVTDLLKSEGYDGIQDTGGKYSGLQHNVYIPFYSNQIKDVTNTNPTSDPDIRYSINTDKLKDSNGNFVPLYHGSPNKFDNFNKGVKNGWLGKGIYFTTNKSYAKKQGKNIITAYADLKNPFVSKENSPDAFLTEVRNIYPNINELNISEVLQENGYDGIIYTHWDEEVGTIINVFEPKDIKINKDTKYSIETDKQTSTPKREKVVDKIAPQTDIKIDNLPDETEKVARILTKAPKKQQDFSFETVKDVLMRKIVDAGNTINTIGKIAKDDVLYPMYNNTKQARQSAEYMIGEKQTDITGTRIVGNSLIEVFEPVKRKGEEYTGKFYEYLLHMHNIDRMAQDKPVFGKSVTAEDSKRIADQLLKENPEFERLANRVYVYNRNLMQWRVDSGLVSQEQADEMNRIYPHYVPTFRDMSGIAGAKVIGNSVNISQTLKKATGSDRDILPIDLSMARQTMQTVQAAKRNLLGNRLLNDALANKDQVGKYITTIEKSDDSLDIDEQSDAALSSEKNNNIFKIYRDGKSVNMYVNNGIFEGLKAISSQTDNTDTSKLLSALSKPNTMFKQLVTGFNPMFMLKNPIRDVQDATLYSKNLREFAKEYPQTFKEMVNNSKDWQLYKSLGGTGSTFFDYETGIENELNKGKLTRAKEATLGRIEYLNMLTEQAPRFAEFKATLEKAGNRDYDTLLKAVYNAADVTVNFGRSGSITQILNKTAVPFLNPSIQGASKTIRTIVTTKGGTEWAKLVTKLALFGILPSVLNELLYWDDEDYEKLNDRDKDVNFVLKYGDNQWIKIPKGRVISFLGNLANRGIRVARGQEVNWGDFLATTLDQTAPISPFESNIVSPIKAVKDNKTWYGSDIVPQRLQQYEPRDQYDEKTDAFSKWLGGILNYSPKKINYLIDAYTGVIGDFALPLTTPTAEKNPFVKAFTIDGTFSNEIGNKFYETKDKYNKYKNDTPTATVVTRYLNKQNEMASDLYAEIRKVQSSNISDKEKKAKASELRELINLIQANAVLYAEEYEQVVNKYINKFPKNPDRSADYAYLMANYELFGPEYAVKTYNLSTYNKNKHKNMQTVFNQIKNNFNTTKPASAQKTETLPTAKDIPTKR